MNDSVCGRAYKPTARSRWRRAQTSCQLFRSPSGHTTRRKVDANKGRLFAPNRRAGNPDARPPLPPGALAQCVSPGRVPAHRPRWPLPGKFCQCLRGQCQKRCRDPEFAASIDSDAMSCRANPVCASSVPARHPAPTLPRGFSRLPPGQAGCRLCSRWRAPARKNFAAPAPPAAFGWSRPQHGIFRRGGR